MQGQAYVSVPLIDAYLNLQGDFGSFRKQMLLHAMAFADEIKGRARSRKIPVPKINGKKVLAYGRYGEKFHVLVEGDADSGDSIIEVQRAQIPREWDAT